MTKEFRKVRPPGGAKAATAALIEACGGIDAAADVAGTGRNTIWKWSDPDENADRSISLRAIRALEKHCSQPIVTEFLAAEMGAVLLRLPDGHLPDPWGAEMALLAKKSADVFGEMAKALAGEGEGGRRVTPLEAGRCILELDQSMAVQAAVRVRLAAVRDAEGDG